MRTNYSSTSLLAYLENPDGKKRQEDKILEYVTAKNGTCLKELEELTGLPQSTVSGRINDLVNAKKVMYHEKLIYADRLRKKIVVYKEFQQGTLELNI